MWDVEGDVKYEAMAPTIDVADKIGNVECRSWARTRETKWKWSSGRRTGRNASALCGPIKSGMLAKSEHIFPAYARCGQKYLSLADLPPPPPLAPEPSYFLTVALPFRFSFFLA